MPLSKNSKSAKSVSSQNEDVEMISTSAKVLNKLREVVQNGRSSETKLAAVIAKIDTTIGVTPLIDEEYESDEEKPVDELTLDELAEEAHRHIRREGLISRRLNQVSNQVSLKYKTNVKKQAPVKKYLPTGLLHFSEKHVIILLPRVPDDSVEFTDKKYYHNLPLKGDVAEDIMATCKHFGLCVYPDIKTPTKIIKHDQTATGVRANIVELFKDIGVGLVDWKFVGWAARVGHGSSKVTDLQDYNLLTRVRGERLHEMWRNHPDFAILMGTAPSNECDLYKDFQKHFIGLRNGRIAKKKAGKKGVAKDKLDSDSSLSELEDEEEEGEKGDNVLQNEKGKGAGAEQMVNKVDLRETADTAETAVGQAAAQERASRKRGRKE